MLVTIHTSDEECRVWRKLFSTHLKLIHTCTLYMYIRNWDRPMRNKNDCITTLLTYMHMCMYLIRHGCKSKSYQFVSVNYNQLQVMNIIKFCKSGTALYCTVQCILQEGFHSRSKPVHEQVWHFVLDESIWKRQSWYLRFHLVYSIICDTNVKFTSVTPKKCSCLLSDTCSFMLFYIYGSTSQSESCTPYFHFSL